MENKFIKITCISTGNEGDLINEWDLIVNVNEIARLHYGFNQIDFRTPFADGSNHVSVTQEEFDRLEKILLEEL